MARQRLGVPGHAGEVVGISSYHSGKHVTLHVKHGRRKPPVKPKRGAPSFGEYDDRPESTHVIPRDQASMYHIGQHVSMTAAPMTSTAIPKGRADTDEDGDDMGEMDGEHAFSDYHRAMRSIMHPKKQKRGGGVDLAKRRG